MSFAWDKDKQATGSASLVWNPRVRFHLLDVQVKVGPHDAKEEEWYFLYRSQLLLSRNLNDNSLALVFLDREAENDAFPKLIIPLGVVYEKDLSQSKNKVDGKMVLKTVTSMVMHVTTKPNKISLFMSAENMSKLDEAIAEAVENGPSKSPCRIVLSS